MLKGAPRPNIPQFLSARSKVPFDTKRTQKHIKNYQFLTKLWLLKVGYLNKVSKRKDIDEEDNP